MQTLRETLVIPIYGACVLGNINYILFKPWKRSALALIKLQTVMQCFDLTDFFRYFYFKEFFYTLRTYHLLTFEYCIDN